MFQHHAIRRSVFVCALVGFSLTLAATARAQQTGNNTINWLGGPGDWNDPTRWQTATSPGAEQRAGIDGGFDYVSLVHFPAAPGTGTAAAPTTVNVAGVDVYPGDTLVLHAGTIAASGTVQSMNGTIELHAGATLATQQHFWSLNGGKLVIAGGGALDVAQQLYLGSDFDSLEVLPRPDGLPYDNHVIATYGSLVGTFNAVTDGITVDYNTPGQIRISGTPIPEPATLGAAALTLAASTLRRRRR